MKGVSGKNRRKDVSLPTLCFRSPTCTLSSFCCQLLGLGTQAGFLSLFTTFPILTGQSIIGGYIQIIHIIQFTSHLAYDGILLIPVIPSLSSILWELTWDWCGFSVTVSFSFIIRRTNEVSRRTEWESRPWDPCVGESVSCYCFRSVPNLTSNGTPTLQLDRSPRIGCVPRVCFAFI